MLQYLRNYILKLRVIFSKTDKATRLSRAVIDLRNGFLSNSLCYFPSNAVNSQ